jgi:hypothetical protein
MKNKPVLYIVNCVDTEGPLNETIEATFERLNSIFNITIEPTESNLIAIQQKKIPLNGLEDAVAKCFAPELLDYNKNWSQIDAMLDEMLSEEYRAKNIDDFGGGLVYSWHCMDHVGYMTNPRHKDMGYGNIFRYYRSKLKNLASSRDEINWHFHPLSITKRPIAAATSYNNNMDLLNGIISRRIIDEKWFPVVNRPGFHSERPDSHLFLEQWIPFDYANQAYENMEDQPDLLNGRFGDWRNAPLSWRGYHPDHDNYQSEGRCRRLIFRCLNVGTRLRALTDEHISQAFEEALLHGGAILAFANHDYRDMRKDITKFSEMLFRIRAKYSEVSIKYSGAEEAIVSLNGWQGKEKIEIAASIKENILHVELISGEVFGPQPYLAIKTKSENYLHDNFDVAICGKKWQYVFDDHTVTLDWVDKIGVGCAGKYGGYSVVNLDAPGFAN